MAEKKTPARRSVLKSDVDRTKSNEDQARLATTVEDFAGAIVLGETTLETATADIAGILTSLTPSDIETALTARADELRGMLDAVSNNAASSIADLGGKASPKDAMHVLFSSRLASGVSPGTLLGKLEAAGDLIEKVVVTVPRGFKLRLDNHTELTFAPGVQTVARFITDHWYAKAHGMKIFETAAVVRPPVPAPESDASEAPTDEVEADTEADVKPVKRKTK